MCLLDLSLFYFINLSIESYINNKIKKREIINIIFHLKIMKFTSEKKDIIYILYRRISS